MPSDAEATSRTREVAHPLLRRCLLVYFLAPRCRPPALVPQVSRFREKLVVRSVCIPTLRAKSARRMGHPQCGSAGLLALTPRALLLEGGWRVSAAEKMLECLEVNGGALVIFLRLGGIAVFGGG